MSNPLAGELPGLAERLTASGGFRCVWARGPNVPAFCLAELDFPRDYRWSQDGLRLWTRGQDGVWSEWDTARRERLRRAPAPDGMLVPEAVHALEQWSAARMGAEPKPTRQLAAVSADLRRAITTEYPTPYQPAELVDLTSNRTLCRLEEFGSRAPFAFSADGSRFVGAARYSPQRGPQLAVASAQDAQVLARVPFEYLDDHASFLWAPGGQLLVSVWHPGRSEDRLICFHLDYQRKLWEERVALAQLQLSGDGRQAVGFTLHEQTVRIWDLDTGQVEREFGRESWGNGPVVCGEPDTCELIERLAAQPVTFTGAREVTELRGFAHGQRASVHVSGERTAHIIETATGSLVPGAIVPWTAPAREQIDIGPDVAEFSIRAVSEDGSLAVVLLGRDPYEQQDPDAGRITGCGRVTVALWDRGCGRWRWETGASPRGLGTGSWLLDQAGCAFTHDESGIFMRGGGEQGRDVYDALTGALRLPRPGDYPAAPTSLAPGERVLASDRGGRRSVVAQDGGVQLWDVAESRLIAELDLAMIADQPACACVLEPGGAVLVGTRLGRLIRLELPQ